MIGDDKIEVGGYQNGRVYPLRKRKWMPVEKLFNLSRESRGVDVRMVYAQSWLITHYMMDDPARQKQMQGYLQAVGRGEDTAKAFTASFGMDFADDLLLLNARFMTRSLAHEDELDMRLGKKALATVRKRAAKYPDDALALRTLAAGELLYGDVAVADTVLDKLLARSPQDIDALYLKAAR